MSKALNRFHVYIKELENELAEPFLNETHIPKGFIVVMVDRLSCFSQEVPNSDGVFQIEVGWKSTTDENLSTTEALVEIVARAFLTAIHLAPFSTPNHALLKNKVRDWSIRLRATIT